MSRTLWSQVRYAEHFLNDDKQVLILSDPLPVPPAGWETPLDNVVQLLLPGHPPRFLGLPPASMGLARENGWFLLVEMAMGQDPHPLRETWVEMLPERALT